MPSKNFTEFLSAAPLTTSDILVGYKADASEEIKTTVQQIIDLVSETDSQTLAYNDASKNLTISSGNTVSLSSLATTTSVNNLQTNIASSTATLLPTSIYSSSSGYWQSSSDRSQSVFQTVSSLSATWEESSEILPTVTNYLSTNSVTLCSVDVKNKILSAGVDLFNIFLTSEIDSQTLSYNKDNNNLTISSGNTVALSSFNNLFVSNGLSITGNISGSNLRTSFNQGSATGDYSFAVNGGKAFGGNSHAEGDSTTASGVASHAEGLSTTASGLASHAEGDSAIASGDASHAEGDSAIASGYASHAAGYRATAAQDYTYAWSDGNLGTLTANVSTTRTGQYMVSASGGVFIPGNVGIGTDNNSNALTVAGLISTPGGTSNDWNNQRGYVHNNFVPLSGGVSIASLSALNTITTNLTALSTIVAPGVNVPRIQMSIFGQHGLTNTNNDVDSRIPWNVIDFNTNTTYLSASTASRNFVILKPGYYRIEARYASYDLYSATNFLRLQVRTSPDGIINAGTGGSLIGTIDQGYVGTTGNGEAMKSGVISLSAATTPLWVVGTFRHSGATGGPNLPPNQGYPVVDNQLGTQPYMLIERVFDLNY